MEDKIKKTGLKSTFSEDTINTLQSSGSEIYALIIGQMEVTRKQNDYSKREFGKVLGLPDTYYSKITTKERGTISLTTFIAFCRLFGFDLSTIVGRSFLSTADSVFMETAVFLSGLSPDTVDAINKVIADSEESESKKKQADVLLTHLKSVKDKPAVLFATDISNNIK